METFQLAAALGLCPHHSTTFSEFWRALCLPCHQEPEETALPLIAFVFLNGSFKKLFSCDAVGAGHHCLARILTESAVKS